MILIAVPLAHCEHVDGDNSCRGVVDGVVSGDDDDDERDDDNENDHSVWNNDGDEK